MKTSMLSFFTLLIVLVHGGNGMKRNKGKAVPNIEEDPYYSPSRIAYRPDPNYAPAPKHHYGIDTTGAASSRHTNNKPGQKPRSYERGGKPESSAIVPVKQPIPPHQIERLKRLHPGPNKTYTTISPYYSKSGEMEWCWIYPDESIPDEKLDAGYFVASKVKPPPNKFIWKSDWKGPGHPIEIHPDEFYRKYYEKYPNGCPCKPGECPDEQAGEGNCGLSSESEDEEEKHNHWWKGTKNNH